MVRALLAGRKSQTRRALKVQPISVSDMNYIRAQKRGQIFIGPDLLPTTPETKLIFGYVEDFGVMRCLGMQNFCDLLCPYGVPGDRLWVRETFTLDFLGPRNKVVYRADEPNANCRWKPSIFMRRNASRITLEITDVRVERVQSITEEDAIKEGISKLLTGGFPWPPGRHCTVPLDHATTAYQLLWDSINGKGSWAKNPWVWVITFKVA